MKIKSNINYSSDDGRNFNFLTLSFARLTRGHLRIGDTEYLFRDKDYYKDVCGYVDELDKIDNIDRLPMEIRALKEGFKPELDSSIRKVVSNKYIGSRVAKDAFDSLCTMLGGSEVFKQTSPGKIGEIAIAMIDYKKYVDKLSEEAKTASPVVVEAERING